MSVADSARRLLGYVNSEWRDAGQCDYASGDNAVSLWAIVCVFFFLLNKLLVYIIVCILSLLYSKG